MKPIIIAIAVIVLIGGIVTFAMMNKPTSSGVTTPINTDNSQNTMFEAKSLHDLLTIGENQTCVFTDATTGTNGTVYITNGSMRGDITTLVNGTNTGSHMIITDNTFYAWMTGQTSGVKASLDELNNVTTNPTTQSIDLNKQVDYDCDSWSVDTTKFTVPATIEFTDMTSIMKSIPTIDPAKNEGSGQGTSPGASNQCAACDNLSGDTKAQCLQALNCL